MQCLRGICCLPFTPPAPTEPEKSIAPSSVKYIPINTDGLPIDYIDSQPDDKVIFDRKAAIKKPTEQFHKALFTMDIEACQKTIGDLQPDTLLKGTVFTPLTFGALRGNTEIVRLLEAQGKTGGHITEEAIRIAEKRHHTEIVSLLSGSLPGKNQSQSLGEKPAAAS